MAINKTPEDIYLKDMIKMLKKLYREEGNLRVTKTFLNGDIITYTSHHTPRPVYLKKLRGRETKNRVWNNTYDKSEDLDNTEKFIYIP